MLADIFIFIDGKFILLMYLFTIIALIFILSTDLFDFLPLTALIEKQVREMKRREKRREEEVKRREEK